jgi:hypothetical protein
VLAGLLAASAWIVPQDAGAFCGFYVAGGDAKLYNNATVVVMMRDGTRTVLSMQNNYQGPPQDFAMVVPVPVILKEADVKTLPREIFATVDTLAAPRLVEYWEQDPCNPVEYAKLRKSAGGPRPMDDGASDVEKKDLGVTIEAKFTVGEYNILILSAKEATGLDTWLRDNKYTIPEGAAETLRPYVQAGMKFFVAKVDTRKVKFDSKGQAMLSPLRFHYDTDTFNLPVRLGLLNSGGAQDLIVHILAKTRYEVANYPNVTIPTNLEVKDAVRDAYAAFYVSLFDATLAQNPKAVITEYAWQANNCDPCPRDPLKAEELMTLGADVLPGVDAQSDDLEYSLPSEFVLTRLHARYGKDSLGEDLVFREAAPIGGGRERFDGKRVEQGSTPDGSNNFQARYIIRHRWTGPVACEKPQYGVWGGQTGPRDKPKPTVAKNLAFAPRTGDLGAFVAQDVPEIKFATNNATPEPTTPEPPTPEPTAPAAELALKKVEENEAKVAPIPVTPATPIPVKPATSGASGCGCREDAGDSLRLAPLVVVLAALRRRRVR